MTTSERHPETAVEPRTALAADAADVATPNSEREATPPRTQGVSDRIRAREPRDWSDYVKVHDQALLDRFGRLLDGYTDRVDIWRYPIAGLQGWRCFYGGQSVLRTFAPVVHRGIDCDGRASAQACARFDRYRVACMNHASALGDRTDAELMAAIDSDPQLKSCYPDPRLPNGHGWCATGVVASDRAMFQDARYQPGGWGDRHNSDAWLPLERKSARNRQIPPETWFRPPRGLTRSWNSTPRRINFDDMPEQERGAAT